MQQEPEEADQLRQGSLFQVGARFNALAFLEAPCSFVLGYCPMLMGSSTELGTIYTVLKMVQKMCESIQQKDAVVTFDLAMYVKAMHFNGIYAMSLRIQ